MCPQQYFLNWNKALTEKKFIVEMNLLKTKKPYNFLKFQPNNEVASKLFWKHKLMYGRHSKSCYRTGLMKGFMDIKNEFCIGNYT